MNGLTIIKQNGGKYIDSREVAEAIGKRHDNLLRDIDGYLKTLEKSNALKIEGVNFFIKSNYRDAKSEARPCYLLSKMGCEMVANKLTGEKGVLFTAAYVAKFNEMETHEKLEQMSSYQPRLGEFNAAARIILPAMQEAGATPKRIVEFLGSIYKPLGITVLTDGLDLNMRTWSASDIAKMLGAYSVNGKPHNLAVSAVVSLLGVDNRHKILVPVQNGMYTGVSIRYDDIAATLVKEWFEKNGYPDEIACGNRVFRLLYAK